MKYILSLLLLLSSCEPVRYSVQVKVTYYDGTTEAFEALYYRSERIKVSHCYLSNGCTVAIYPTRCNVKAIEILKFVP